MIKRCPFCGRKAEPIQIYNKWGICCSSCTCTLVAEYDTMEDAIFAWNSRSAVSYNLNPETVINFVEENGGEKVLEKPDCVIYTFDGGDEISIPLDYESENFEDEMEQAVVAICDYTLDFPEIFIENLGDVKVSCTSCINFVKGECISKKDCYKKNPEDEVPESMRIAHAMPELGNILFGNSMGIYPIERDEIQEIFWSYFEEDFDYHMYYLDENDKEHTTDRGGYENDIFVANPYYWGDDDDIMDEPNFIYKPEGIEISWYKYPLRDSYSNIQIDKEVAHRIFKHCAESIKERKN